MVIEMKMVRILLLNAYLTGNNVAWKSNGVVELQENEKMLFIVIMQTSILPLLAIFNQKLY